MFLRKVFIIFPGPMGVILDIHHNGPPGRLVPAACIRTSTCSLASLWLYFPCPEFFYTLFTLKLCSSAQIWYQEALIEQEGWYSICYIVSPLSLDQYYIEWH